MEGTVEILINSIVNLYQGFIVTWFLIQCLEVKEKYSRKFVHVVGTITIFMYLELQFIVTGFEGVRVLLLMFFTTFFSALFFKESIIRKILYNVILIISSVFTATLVGSLIGVVSDMGYIQLVTGTSIQKYISLFLNQILLWLVFKCIARLLGKNSLGTNTGYTLLVIFMSIVSAITVVVLQYLIVDSSAEYKLLYALILVVGIILLLVINLIMYGISEKNYIDKLKQEIEINAYRRQKYDAEEIMKNYQEIEKVRHEINKVIETTNGLLADGKYDEAEKFMKEFETEESNRIKKINYTDNVILNYLLNQKMEICKKENIEIKYFINGVVDGIKETDLHCVISNLLDNAIEATQKIENKSIELYVFANSHSILIRVSNTIEQDMIRNNPRFKSSKIEKNHGYGIVNVKAVVEKYHGKIEYKQKIEDYLTCEVILMKEFATENGNSRQIY